LAKRDYSRKSRKTVHVDVQADFWNGDPDIDAICRMEHAPECCFDPGCFPIAANKPGPFNSQNTFLSGACLKDYFMFSNVGRMDDIWASYYLQAKGCQVVWNKASVRQRRNVHDLVIDMKQEYAGYENNLKLVKDLAADAESLLAYLPGRSAWAFQLYQRHFADASCLGDERGTVHGRRHDGASILPAPHSTGRRPVSAALSDNLASQR
jgi:hypothetical protein